MIFFLLLRIETLEMNIVYNRFLQTVLCVIDIAREM